jgi:hypothetical protein
MAEVLGKLDPEADTSMLTDYDSLSPLEQAQVTLALSKQVERMMTEAKESEIGLALGKFIVAMEDGRVLASSYSVFIGKEEEN